MDYGNCVIGIEFGSTRLKAVMLDEKNEPVASGSYGWENNLVNGVWTYGREEFFKGLRGAYAELKKDAEEKFGSPLRRVKAIGVSAMMHGYLAFDKNGEQLAEFRTWRNTMTAPAAGELSDLFDFAIPQRWSVAHLYQAILKGEEHVGKIAFLTTLAGYMHYVLTGRKVLGLNDASGMFPIDPETLDYDAEMAEKFDRLTARHGFKRKMKDIFPRPLAAGEDAGYLTEEGARLMDESGELEAGIPFCPPEGDSATGMVATNSVRAGYGNVSGGTSMFATVVCGKKLKRDPAINVVVSPTGKNAAIIHGNNSASDIDGWAGVFGEFASLLGAEADGGRLLTVLFTCAMSGDPDCGGLVNYGPVAAEPTVGFEAGRPLLMRGEGARFTLGNLFRAVICYPVAVQRAGIEVLKKSGVSVDMIYAHGGYFKTPRAGQLMLSSAFGCPVSAMKTAGEGGAYGVALLASYLVNKEDGQSLEDFLDSQVFAGAEVTTVTATEAEKTGFDRYYERFVNCLGVEKAAYALLK
ncbi:MAG: ATPase [Clostridia bacterium]|nr:ATPase [Clostridia bacterium]